MKWLDIDEIVEQLIDQYPDSDPKKILFVDLRLKIINLPEFDDDPNRSNERILEAIQQKWIEEK